VSTTVKAVTRVAGPFPQIKAGSLICPAKSSGDPMILLVLEILTPTNAKCMVMVPGTTRYLYGYTACWNHSADFVMWQGELTITQ
jgi:hypothetical protein